MQGGVTLKLRDKTGHDVRVSPPVRYVYPLALRETRSAGSVH